MKVEKFFSDKDENEVLYECDKKGYLAKVVIIDLTDITLGGRPVEDLWHTRCYIAFYVDTREEYENYHNTIHKDKAFENIPHKVIYNYNTFKTPIQ